MSGIFILTCSTKKPFPLVSQSFKFASDLSFSPLDILYEKQSAASYELAMIFKKDRQQKSLPVFLSCLQDMLDSRDCKARNAYIKYKVQYP